HQSDNLLTFLFRPEAGKEAKKGCSTAERRPQAPPAGFEPARRGLGNRSLIHSGSEAIGRSGRQGHSPPSTGTGGRTGSETVFAGSRPALFPDEQRPRDA